MRPVLLSACAFLALAGCQTIETAAEADAPQGAWREVLSLDGSQPGGHAEGSFAHVDGKLIILGGRGNPPAHIFDLDSCSWRQGSTAPFQIHHFQAVTVGDNIYAIGALTDRYPEEPPVAHVMIYNVPSDSWRQGPEIPESRRRGAAAAVRIGEWIYVLNGIQVGHSRGHVNWTDRFNTITGEWQVLVDSPRPRDHLAGVLVDGKIVVGGGRLSMAPDKTFTETVREIDIYDPASNSWSTAAQAIPTERAGIAAAFRDGTAVFIGGESAASTAAHADVQAYTPDRGFSRLPDLPIPRHGFGAANVREGGEDAIYVAGGVPTRGGGEQVLTLLRYGTKPGPCDKS